MGATVVSKRTWKKVSEEDRAIVVAAAREFQAFLLAEIPGQERDAIAAMRERGLEVLPVGKSERGPWLELAESFSESMRASRLPAEIFDLALRERDVFRREHED